MIRQKRLAYSETWPILEKAGEPPVRWSGWPDRKRFALVLTHDVDTAKGHANCPELMAIEKKLGFRSSFNFVPERYEVSPRLRTRLTDHGFEVGVHGLNHDGKLYKSESVFMNRSHRINQYLTDWNAVGFRSPAMHCKPEWIHHLNIEYDSSTFDTDPFEPGLSVNADTIFPFWVSGNSGSHGYMELPYTLPQDFTLFVLLKEKNIGIWKRKLEWIAEKGGMALMNTHPDYMNFNGANPGTGEFPAAYYFEFLYHIKKKYAGQYWQALPRDVASFCRKQISRKTRSNNDD
ncbi:hypothetical protein [Desulfonema ishimotonii]|uniref:hypothetical protein n=1 Tax=Desulfonema ishimotonii TaxID=45657 RepID=UPI001AA07D8C|nr:hypothetical protein [Desulfonema ishimotonii]